MEPTISASALWERMAAWDEELRGEKPSERPQVTYGTRPTGPPLSRPAIPAADPIVALIDALSPSVRCADAR